VVFLPSTEVLNIALWALVVYYCQAGIILHGRFDFHSKRNPMPNETLIAKATIIGNSIRQDQAAVAQQWFKTFKHNSADDPATNMAKLMLACVAYGDFKTSSSLLKSKELGQPNRVLSSIDYLSHASRIIFDYKNLSQQHQKEFLDYFPKAGERGVVSRCATHAAVRNGDKIKELKGFLYGLIGQIPSYIKNAYDFGINIAMGGEGQTNYINKNISKNGFSGHMYFHHYSPDQIIMAGLEQSAPASGLLDALWGHHEEAPDIQVGSDQFGQGHSLIGASDTFTAAGSLYFSDPVYQAKLLAETGAVTPDKYGAMQVTLTDENWPQIKNYLISLNENLKETRTDQVMQQLLRAPSTASQEIPEVQSYIAFDFKSYLSQIRFLLEAEPQGSALLERHLPLQNELLIRIQKLRQEGYTQEVYQQFSEIINQICALDSTPEAYKGAILRIRYLFERQCKIDPNLERVHVNLLIQQRCNETLDNIKELQEKARVLQVYFSSDHISQENGVGQYLEHLAKQMQELEGIKARVTGGLVFEDVPSLEKGLDLQDELEKNWLNISAFPLVTLNGYQDTIQAFAEFLRKTPRLVSETLYLKLQAEMLTQRQALLHSEALLQESQAREKELTASLDKLTRIKEIQIEQIQSFETALAKAEIKISGLCDQLLQYKHDIARLTTNQAQGVIELQEELQFYKHNEQDLEERLTALTSERDRLVAAKISLELELQQQFTAHSQLKQQFAQAQLSNHRLALEASEGAKALSSTKVELLRLSTQVSIYEKTIEQLNVKSKMIAWELGLASETVKIQAGELSTLQQQLVAAQTEFKKVKRELDSSLEHIEQLMARITSAEKHHPAELVRLRNELQQEQLRHAELNDRLQEKFDCLETQNTKLEEIILTKTNVLQTKQLLVQQLHRKLVAVEANRASLRKEIEQMQEEFTQEKTDLLARLDDETQDNKSTQALLKSVDHLLETTLAETATLEKEVLELSSSNSENELEIQRLQQRLQELTEQPSAQARADKKHQQQIKKLLISLAPIFIHLKQVELQAKNLREREFHDAAQAAFKLVGQINTEIDHYLDTYNTQPKALQKFKANCDQHIRGAAEILEQHRGWKWILGNLSCFILSLGVGYLLAGSINLFCNDKFTFFNQTTSMAKVCGLKESINGIENSDEILSAQKIDPFF
jgi:hypothetical protein